jgi:cell pole-organizing protein PopZ
MSEAKGQQEPSMEEILASIRRIIAEDNDTGKPEEEAAPPPSPPPPPPPPSPMRMPEPEPAPMALEDDVLELTEVVEEEPEESYPPLEDPFPPRRFEIPGEEGLVSKATAAASTAAFAAMHSRARERRGGDVYLGDGAITLEEIVKELLRPQLQEWLDQNLPSLVERLVREEIERLARAAK